MAREQIKKDIITPCPEEVQRYLDKWEEEDNVNYVRQEEALDELFIRTYPQNTDIKQVIIKVSALNDFYSTNIFKVYFVAKNIVDLNIDKRIASNDLNLVKDIANVRVLKQTGNNEERIINFYSFATKYCSRHNPTVYPIYDYYVDRILRYFRNTGQTIKFKNEELKDYTKYRDIILEFRKKYGLEQFDLKQIDRYLWQLGKDNFPRYGKKLKQVVAKFKNVPFSIEFCEKTDFYTCQATIGDIEMFIQVDVSDKEIYIVTGCLDIGADGYDLPLCKYSRELYDVTEEKGLKSLIVTFLDYTSSNTDKIYKIIEPN